MKKKYIIWALMVVFTASMVFTGVGCGTTTATEAVAEETTATEAVAEETTATEAVAEETTATGDEEEIKIVLSSQFEPQPNVFSWMFGMEEAAKQMGCAVEHFGPTSNAVADQIDQLNSIIASEPDGIALIITDAAAFADTIVTMNEQGIPWGTFNTGFMGIDEKQLFYVGADHYASGRAIAEYALANAGFEIKNSLTLNQQPGHSALDARTKGELDVMHENGLTGDEIDASLSLDECLARTKAYLIEHPDTGVIFTNGGAINAMATQAVDELGLKDKVVLALHDADTWTCDAIKDGTALATSEQQFFLQGYLAVVNLYNYIKWGSKPVENNVTGPNIIDKTNVDRLVKLNEAIATVYGSS